MILVIGPHKAPLVPPAIHAAHHERAGHARLKRPARPALPPGCPIRKQPAATAILHPQDSAKSHKKRTWTQHERAGRARIASWLLIAAGCTRPTLPPALRGWKTSGYGHLTRSRPQDRPFSSQAVGRQGGLTDLCEAMSALPLISSALHPAADILDKAGNVSSLPEAVIPGQDRLPESRRSPDPAILTQGRHSKRSPETAPLGRAGAIGDHVS